jgi:hypothetical protein
MPKKGFENYLYINTGTAETPVWTEIDLAKDVNVNKDKGELDANCRKYARDGFAVVDDGLKTVGYEFESLVPATGETANAGFTALESAYNDNASVDIIRADGAMNGTDVPGERVTCGVFGGSRGEPLDGMTTVSYTLKAKSVPAAGTFTSGTWTADV